MADILLPANLPENWAWDQIVPPNGSDIGATEEYGYNYLMKQVNAAQKACMELAAENERLREELTKKANMGPVEQYDLELTEGFIARHTSKYWKNAFGEVFVSFGVWKGAMENNINSLDMIAMLTEGFHPSEEWVGSGEARLADNSSTSAATSINLAGEIRVNFGYGLSVADVRGLLIFPTTI